MAHSNKAAGAATLSLEAQLEALQAENAALKARKARISTPTFLPGKSGGLSLYGMGRYPVTLYAEQWETIFDQAVRSDFDKARIVAEDLGLLATRDGDFAKRSFQGCPRESEFLTERGHPARGGPAFSFSFCVTHAYMRVAVIHLRAKSK